MTITFSTRKAHYINYLFGVLFFIAPAVLVLCYFLSHRDEFEGVAILILLLLGWLHLVLGFASLPGNSEQTRLPSLRLDSLFVEHTFAEMVKRLNFGGFGHECVSKSLVWDEIEWIKYTYQSNAKYPNALFVKIKTGEVFSITFAAYSYCIPIIKEIEQYKECVYGRTSEEKAFKNPDILED